MWFAESRSHVENLHQRRGSRSQPAQQNQLQHEEDKKGSYIGIFKENVHQYLLNTTLHGLKYVGDKTITRFERLFFAFTFLLVVILSAYFISNIWYKWTLAPLIITQSAVSIPVTDLPFPAVTICNMNQAQKTDVQDLPHRQEEYAVLHSICRDKPHEHGTNSVAARWHVYRKVLLKVAQPCEEMLRSCAFGHVDVNCMKLFTTILTDGGLCCIFNGLHPKFMMKFYNNKTEEDIEDNDEYMESMANNWSPEAGFHSEELKLNKDGYPKPGLGSGNHLGLTLVLNVSINEYYCSTSSGHGFRDHRVLVHSPHELPEIDEYGLAIANGYESRIVATPIISRASDAVRHIPRKIRQCLYESENFLTHYRIYSRRNCQKECITKIFYENCHCVMYHMPRLHPNITICGRSENDCVEQLRDEIHIGSNKSYKCTCPYGCHDIKFEMELSSTPIFDGAPQVKNKGLTAANASILQVYYQRGYYRSQDKEELIGFTEFLSNIGGLLGLFMGFSIFSIIEIVYFVSIRPYCNCMKNAERRRQTVQQGFNRFNNIKLRRLNSNHVSTSSMNNILFTH